MTIARADVTRLASAQASASAYAADDLAGIIQSVRSSDPRVIRDLLLEAVPALTQEYGDLSATVAAEWYEEMRGREVGGTFTARAGGVSSEDAVAGSVRYSARHLFGDDVDDAVRATVLRELTGSLQRHINYAGRDTIARNVRLDPSRPRFARVPSTSENTCSWCAVMASRGFVYHSASTAGERNDYHDNCACQIVPQWDSAASHIEGYDPDDLYEMYQIARDELGGGQASSVAGKMRELFPDRFDH